ncbi:MAG: tail fiber domain-containing protein, partial [Xanthomonadales bacterium]|nr:tail fiber domain-containing protein [Xanthomonadales bacterium]
DLELTDPTPSIMFNDSDAQPSVEWRMDGWDEAFELRDEDAGTVPFSIVTGARNNALFIDAFGFVGLGTSVPEADLHLLAEDSPIVRFHQEGGVFGTYIWELLGNELGFSLLDLSASSTPIRVMAGAPSDALVVDPTGMVGLGTALPSAHLHISASQAEIQMFDEQFGHSGGFKHSQNFFRFFGRNGAEALRFENHPQENSIVVRNSGNIAMGLNINDAKLHIRNTLAQPIIKADQGANTRMELSSSGNLSIDGTLTQGSSRDWKENIRPVDSTDLLARVKALEISEWNYTDDQADTRHVGPMAQDFYAAFGFGPDEEHITVSDLAGVSLAAVQALAEQNDMLRAQNLSLEQRLHELEQQNDRIEVLEAMVLELAKDQVQAVQASVAAN